MYLNLVSEDNEENVSINWPRRYKSFITCSTQMSMKFIRVVKVKMPTISCARKNTCFDDLIKPGN